MKLHHQVYFTHILFVAYGQVARDIGVFAKGERLYGSPNINEFWTFYDKLD
jgi:hypothetical protein